MRKQLGPSFQRHVTHHVFSSPCFLPLSSLNPCCSLEEKDKAVAKLERELLEKEDELNEIRRDP